MLLRSIVLVLVAHARASTYLQADNAYRMIEIGNTTNQ